MHKDKRDKLDKIVTVMVVLSIGIVISGLLAWEIARNVYAEWHARAISDAQRLSTELHYRVQREQEPLVAASTLYFGSNEVTVDELRAARQKLIELGAQAFSLAYGFIVTDPPGTYQVQYSTGLSSLLMEGQGPALADTLQHSAELALANTSSLVIGDLFSVNQTSYLPFTMTVPNGEQQGVLLYLVNFSALLHDVSAELDSEKLQLTITHPVNPETTHTLSGSSFITGDVEHRTSIDMGVYTWDLQWSFASDYGDSPKYTNAYALFFSGILFTILSALYIRSLIDQKSIIQLQVDEKSAQLEQTQGQMIQQGKMAALGSMVAGISHELNTPIGNGLMAASVLAARTQDIKRDLESDQLTQSELEEYLVTACDSTKIIEQNLRRAANLVASFKQVAVDQTSSRKRNFNIATMLEELETTLQPQLKQTPHTLMIDSPKHLPLKSYPGPLGQVLTNLVMNSLNHAFSPSTSGVMKITVKQISTSAIIITYSDSGAGISQEIAGKVFDPFFTTQLGKGGSGLGLHIAWNLVTEILGGEITLMADKEEGVKFLINIPIVAP